MEIKVRLENEKTFIQFDKLEKNFPRVVRNAIRRTLEKLRGEIQRNLVTGKYGITSKKGLKGSFEVFVEATKTSFRGVTGSNLKYAEIHERGGVIVPKAKKFLHFFIDGQEIFTKRVNMPARWYVRNTFLEEQKNLVRILENALGMGLA